jgi:hypothetical protein
MSNADKDVVRMRLHIRDLPRAKVDPSNVEAFGASLLWVADLEFARTLLKAAIPIGLRRQSVHDEPIWLSLTVYGPCRSRKSYDRACRRALVSLMTDRSTTAI